MLYQSPFKSLVPHAPFLPLVALAAARLRNDPVDETAHRPFRPCGPPLVPHLNSLPWPRVFLSENHVGLFVWAGELAPQPADPQNPNKSGSSVVGQLMTSGKKQYVRDVALTATDITLTLPDPKFPDLEWKDEAGVAYRSNLLMIKQLKITFARGAGFKAGRYPVGEKDGKLYLLEPAPAK